MATQSYGTAAPRIGATTEGKTMPKDVGYGNKRRYNPMAPAPSPKGGGVAHPMAPAPSPKGGGVAHPIGRGGRGKGGSGTSNKQIRMMAAIASGRRMNRVRNPPSRAAAKRWIGHKKGTGLVSRAMRDYHRS